jgi:hypothetical protein
MAGMKNLRRLLRSSICICAICGSPLAKPTGCPFCNEHLMSHQIIGRCAT